MTEWQPIETVRGDGVPVWLYDPEHGAVVVGWWSEVRDRWELAGYDEVGFDPTHWMPLAEPEPPS